MDFSLSVQLHFTIGLEKKIKEFEQSIDATTKDEMRK
jgi:hypothetical protein